MPAVSQGSAVQHDMAMASCSRLRKSTGAGAEMPPACFLEPQGAACGKQHAGREVSVLMCPIGTAESAVRRKFRGEKPSWKTTSYYEIVTNTAKHYGERQPTMASARPMKMEFIRLRRVFMSPDLMFSRRGLRR